MSEYELEGFTELHFEPVGDKVIVKQTEAADVSEGGVILPDISQEETMVAEVIAVGPGVLLITGEYGKMQTKPGDMVLYPKLGAKKIEYKGEDYIALKENDIITILKGEKDGGNNK